MARVNDQTVKMNIEKLMQYGVQSGLIDVWDLVFVRNGLLEQLRLEEPYDGDVEFMETDDFHVVLQTLVDYAVEKGLIPDDTFTERDLFGTQLMGLLTPRPSEVIRRFQHIRETQSIAEATAFYYAFSQATNYIRTDQIAKNLCWKTATEFGLLDISVNLSKPEKDPREIAKLQSIQRTGYPKCLLCLENVGYPGRLDHPARHNHRVIPLSLGGEPWYLQYSPYSYYNEHCIVFSEEHVPMNLDHRSLARMFEFVEMVPHYFLGANAGLPIVGGSILSHDHYQGGRAVFPIEAAQPDRVLYADPYPTIQITTPKWCMSCIRLNGKNREELLDLACSILDQWKHYSDETVEIVAYSRQGNTVVAHNAITPIIRKKQDGSYEIDLVLRNNRTSEEHPDGIFHPHQELHHIKKENIGVIEVMGLAILPGRLASELHEIQQILTGNRIDVLDVIGTEGHSLQKHQVWIQELIRAYGTSLPMETAEQVVREEVGHKFLSTLLDASVFKQNPAGKEAFSRCLRSMGFRIVG